MLWQNLLFEKMRIKNELDIKPRRLIVEKHKYLAAEFFQLIIIVMLTSIFILGGMVGVSQADLVSQYSRLYGGLYYIFFLILGAFAYNFLILIGKFIIKDNKYYDY